MRKYYVTTPIYYINDKAHIGHIYCTMSADIVARYRRMLGYDVMFLTGTDENATKVEQAASQKGMKTQAFVDELANHWKEYFKNFNLTHDDFIRTTESRHIKSAQEVFKRLHDSGDIYKGSYEGHYCVPCETYFMESDLKDGNCPDCGRPVEKISEENYFFKLSEYREKLLSYYDEHPDFILPKKRFNEVYSTVKKKLRDVSFSRSGKEWGIPVPFDKEHTIYVWGDALVNYLTGVGFPDDNERFNKYWPADIHIIGKDIIRFHCIIWPAMLMSLGLPLPEHIYAHGWWTINGEKVSKSKSNIVRPHEEIEDLVKVSGVSEPLARDAFRFYIFRELPFGDDGDFSQEKFFGRYNADLANDLGNLLNRTQQMVFKDHSGKVPEGEILPEIQRKFDDILPSYHKFNEEFRFSKALETIWEFVGTLNGSIEIHKPWELKKQGKIEEHGNLMRTLLEGIAVISSLVSPFIPESAKVLATGVGLNEPPKLINLNMDNLTPGSGINKTESMFPRISKKRLSKLTQEGLPSDENMVTIEEFAKIKFKIGTILSVENVKDADKLLKIQVDTGKEKRQVIAGIAPWYKPEELVGKQVCIVANLKPAKLRGELSEGMLLAASGKEYVTILSPEKKVEPGSKVK